MRVEGHVVSSGGGWGGDTKVPKKPRQFRERPPAPPSPTRIRNPAPEHAQQPVARRGTSRKGLVYGPRPDGWDNPLSLPKDRVDEIVALYKGGMSANKITDKTGVAKSTVLRHLRANGIEIRGSEKPLDMEAVARAYDAGVSVREIGRAYGVAAATISRRLRMAGHDMSRGGKNG